MIRNSEQQGTDGMDTRRGIETAEAWGEWLGESVGGLYRSARDLGSGAAGEGSHAAGPTDSTTARAENLVGQAEQKISTFASLASDGIRRIAARAREEYEDVMAEAQAKRDAQSRNTPQG